MKYSVQYSKIVLKHLVRAAQVSLRRVRLRRFTAGIILKETQETKLTLMYCKVMCAKFQHHSDESGP